MTLMTGSVDPGRYMTLEDYASLDEPENEYVTELVRGRVVREPRPGGTHGTLQVRLAYHLERWAREHRPARVTAESGYILSTDLPTVRGPDVAVVLEPGPSGAEPGGWIRGAPDLAVEVLSPSDRASSIRAKTQDYFEAGAARVWIVDPATSTVTVHRPDRTSQVLRAPDTLTEEELFPGFSLPLDELFGEIS